MFIATASLIVGFMIPTTGSDIDLVPGDGIGLAPNPAVATDRSAFPSTKRQSTLPGSFPLSVGGAVAAAGVGYRRRREDPLVVLVHGDGGSPENFDTLVASLGVPPERIVAFDYSVVDGGGSSEHSSHLVPTTDAAVALDALIRGLSQDNANIYSIHHSRGGSVGVEMIAGLDDGTRLPIDGYRGAALLDPAIAAGSLGYLQSVGRGSSRLAVAIPDDGGFDPIRCADGSCRDVRQHLGRASGVEVVAIRNPDAEVTNFDDRPQGLRVFDVVDRKVSAWLYGLVHPVLGWKRVTEAHGSVLTDADVAACVVAEIEKPGSCRGLGDGLTYVYASGGGGRNRVL